MMASSRISIVLALCACICVGTAACGGAGPFAAMVLSYGRGAPVGVAFVMPAEGCPGLGISRPTLNGREMTLVEGGVGLSLDVAADCRAPAAYAPLAAADFGDEPVDAAFVVDGAGRPISLAAKGALGPQQLSDGLHAPAGGAFAADGWIVARGFACEDFIVEGDAPLVARCETYEGAPADERRFLAFDVDDDAAPGDYDFVVRAPREFDVDGCEGADACFARGVAAGRTTITIDP